MQIRHPKKETQHVEYSHRTDCTAQTEMLKAKIIAGGLHPIGLIMMTSNEELKQLLAAAPTAAAAAAATAAAALGQGEEAPAVASTQRLLRMQPLLRLLMRMLCQGRSLWPLTQACPARMRPTGPSPNEQRQQLAPASRCMPSPIWPIGLWKIM